MRTCLYTGIIILLLGCTQSDSKSSLHQAPVSNSSNPMKLAPLDREQLYDKMLGMLAGSAIGDAMGAPTEMWSRDAIQLEYGHVDRLDDMVREPSAEGTWDINLPKGSTTDDTRWKVLLGEFLTGTSTQVEPHKPQLQGQAFARHLVQHYARDLDNLKNTEGLDLEPYEAEMMKLAWLKEWVQVAKPYAEGDLQAYSESLSKFYGGEMVCAGMLFAPILGAYYPGDPDWAYTQTYDIDLFDLGYARDISGLTAAMVAEAFKAESSPDSIIHLGRKTDPKNYFKSRLVGRTSYKVYQKALGISTQARSVDVQAFFKQAPPVKLAISLKNENDSLRYAQWSTAYHAMDAELMRYPFHPSEIYLVNMVALMLCEFDFTATLAFVVNYGRDNDTTAAVTGAIVGAYWGAGKLPQDMLKQVLQANLDLGIDLEKLAARMTRAILGQSS